MDYEILAEYRKQWNPKKQPGAGFLFWKWLLNHKGNSECCHSVLITKLEPNGYAEFPDHDELRNFDASDKKFVAVSVAHLSHPPILQATDSKWWGWKSALESCGVIVDFICPEEIEKKFHKKMGES